jgi:hypothetical protein
VVLKPFHAEKKPRAKAATDAEVQKGNILLETGFLRPVSHADSVPNFVSQQDLPFFAFASAAISARGLFSSCGLRPAKLICRHSTEPNLALERF